MTENIKNEINKILEEAGVKIKNLLVESNKCTCDKCLGIEYAEPNITEPPLYSLNPEFDTTDEG